MLQSKISLDLYFSLSFLSPEFPYENWISPFASCGLSLSVCNLLRTYSMTGSAWYLRLVYKTNREEAKKVIKTRQYCSLFRSSLPHVHSIIFQPFFGDVKAASYHGWRELGDQFIISWSHFPLRYTGCSWHLLHYYFLSFLYTTRCLKTLFAFLLFEREQIRLWSVLPIN